MKLNEKLKKLSVHLESGLVGRRDHARMLLLAAVAGENAILFGPPGTAKSLLACRLKDCFAEDVRYFECSLKSAGLTAKEIRPEEGDEHDSNHIRVATMHRAKGLEFDEVVLTRAKKLATLIRVK